MNVSCHCGNVVIRLNKAPEEVGECNCSICHRYAALWAYFTPEQVDIATNTMPTQYYLWGDKEVQFHHCPQCGCITHYVTTQKCDIDRVAINMRMANLDEIAKLPVRKIDGANY